MLTGVVTIFSKTEVVCSHLRPRTFWYRVASQGEEQICDGRTVNDLLDKENHSGGTLEFDSSKCR